MSKEYWEKLHGLYSDIQNGQPQVQAGPPVHQGGSVDGYANGGLVEPQGFADGGLVDNASQRETDYVGGGQKPAGGYQSSPWWMDAAKGFAGNLIPAAGQAATGMLIDRMFPGTPGKIEARDYRQPEMQQGSQMALERLKNLERNPNSFGLPGDPNDVNTPAGQRMYQIKKNSRSAYAAAGALETGGAAEHETNAVNKAIGNEYNQIQNQGFQNLNTMTPQLQRNEIAGVANPWSKILTSALAPGMGKGLSAATEAAMKHWFI